MSFMVFGPLLVVPDESGVERLGGEHGEYHHAGKGHDAEAGLDAGQGVQLDERGHQGDHEDVEHGPAPEEFGDSIELGPLPPASGAAALHRDQ